MKRSTNFSRFAAVIFAGAALTGALQASVYDAVADFHDPSVTNSAWSYGTSATLGGTFVAFPNYVVNFWNQRFGDAGLGDVGYFTSSSGYASLPAVLKNTTSGALDVVGPSTSPTMCSCCTPALMDNTRSFASLRRRRRLTQ